MRKNHIYEKPTIYHIRAIHNKMRYMIGVELLISEPKTKKKNKIKNKNFCVVNELLTFIQINRKKK